MGSPHVYVHRIKDGAERYMTPANIDLLESFATFACVGNGQDRVPHEEVVKGLTGATALLSLNGSGAPDVTTEALQSVGTVEVAVISHWWHGMHSRAQAMWEAAGVEVIDASDGNNESVAEWVVASAIMGLRKMLDFDKGLKSGSPWCEPRGHTKLLSESVVGLVGLGRVGKWVARYLRPFGTKVIAHDRYVPEEEAEDVGVRLTSLQEVMTAADVVSFHLPVTEETTGMIGARELAWIRDGAVVVNSARTAILDSDAFMAELGTRRFCAFLDVHDEEPLPLDSPLRSMDHVFISPHIAGFSDSMFERCGRTAIDAIRAYFDKES